MKKSFAVLIFLLSFVWWFVVCAASTDKPDLIFDKTRTNISRKATQKTTYNLQYFVQNIWKWIVFKSTKTYFVVRCKDKNWKIVKERKYKWKMNDIKIEKFIVKESVLPVSCNLDVENKIAETNEKNNYFIYKSSDSPIQDNVSDTNKWDLTISSIWLDMNYPTPKVWDKKFYINATIKNLWKSISFSEDTKWILYCSSSYGKLIHYEIKKWNLNTNKSLDLKLIANEDNFLIPFPNEKNNYTVNCVIQLVSKTVRETDDKNNYKNISFNVTSENTNSQQTLNWFDLIIDNISIYGDIPSLYNNNFTVQSKIKNIWNIDFGWEIWFICEDYSIAEWQTIIRNQHKDIFIKAGEYINIINEWLISNFYNKWYSKTMQCVAGVKNDINPNNNSKRFSFDTVEKTIWLWDLSLKLLSVDKIYNKITFNIKNVWNNQIILNQTYYSDVICKSMSGYRAGNYVWETSYQWLTDILLPWNSYKAIVDLSWSMNLGISWLNCTVADRTSDWPEISKDNNSVRFNYNDY